jgi:hypothetical protein
MAQQNIYPIQLLNDLHNHFPDILYNPGRFNSVQDLLDYVRRVADVNPFTRGMNYYNTRQTIRQNNSVNNTNTTPSAFNTPTHRIRHQSAIPVQPFSTSMPIYDPPLMSVTYREVPQVQPVQPAPHTRVLPNSSANIINTLFSSILGRDILNIPITTDEYNMFLNETVPVYPTNEQITNASRVYSVTTRMENICTICQDGIESEQQVRHLTQCDHYFHKSCIDTWFRQNVHCPTCRQDIREVNNNTSTTTAPPPVPSNYRHTNIYSHEG